jgi:hypothetical protein
MEKCPVCGGSSVTERRDHFFVLPKEGGEEKGMICSNVLTIVCQDDDCGEQCFRPESLDECNPKGRQPDRYVRIPVYDSRT